MIMKPKAASATKRTTQNGIYNSDTTAATEAALDVFWTTNIFVCLWVYLFMSNRGKVHDRDSWPVVKGGFKKSTHVITRFGPTTACQTFHLYHQKNFPFLTLPPENPLFITTDPGHKALDLPPTLNTSLYPS